MNKTLMMLATTLMFGSAAMANDAPTPPNGDGPPPRHDRMMKEMDTNNDGVITKAESAAFHEKKFDEIDTNKDGKITKEEREAFREKHKAEWKQRKAEREKHRKAE